MWPFFDISLLQNRNLKKLKENTNTFYETHWENNQLQVFLWSSDYNRIWGNFFLLELSFMRAEGIIFLEFQSIYKLYSYVPEWTQDPRSHYLLALKVEWKAVCKLSPTELWMILRAGGMSWIWMSRSVPVLLRVSAGYVCGMEWPGEGSLNSLLKIILLMFLSCDIDHMLMNKGALC